MSQAARLTLNRIIGVLWKNELLTNMRISKQKYGLPQLSLAVPKHNYAITDLGFNFTRDITVVFDIDQKP